jgi:hypothetical protein
MLVACPFKSGSWCLAGDPRLAHLEECLECDFNEVQLKAKQTSTKPEPKLESAGRNLIGNCQWVKPCVCQWCGRKCDCGEVLCENCLPLALEAEATGV